MAISDTSPEIAAMQIEVRRKMSTQQRFRAAVELSDLAHEFRKAGIRMRHPEWSERQIVMELLRLAFLPDPIPAWVR